MNPNIGYIIEKMRGDSLSPLGSSKSVDKDIDFINTSGYIDVTNSLSNNKKSQAMTFLTAKLIANKRYVLSYGKWELVVDDTKFYKMGFYYKTELPDGVVLYLYVCLNPTKHSNYGVVVGCTLTGSESIILKSSSDVVAGNSLDVLDKFFKKVFGIDTFLKDYDKYNAII